MSKFFPKSGRRKIKLVTDSKGSETDVAVAQEYKVAICVPCGDQMHSGTAYDLARLVGFTIAKAPHVEVSLVFHKSSVLPASRAVLAQNALRTPGTSHMLWIDSDMRFPKDSLLRLLSMGEKIVGANYPTRGEPILPVAYSDVDGKTRHYTESDEESLCEVAIAGFGMLMIDVEVFQNVEKPWFQIGYSPDDDDYQGEDVFFLLKAKDAGYHVMLDPKLSREVGHLGEYEYNNETALGYREAMRKNG